MKNANLSRLGGFTLIELLVVVLIIGILAAMAMPQYFKAVERSRMTDAITIMDSVAKAQRRKWMQTNRYADDFRGLDVSPKGATGRMYFTKGDPVTGAGGNGFRMALSIGGSFRTGIMNAVRMVDGNYRHPSLQYQYALGRIYQSDNFSCRGYNQAGMELCADFCGIDTPVRECCNDGTSTACNPFSNN